MKFENIKLRADAPYPELKNCVPNAQCVTILRNLANDRVGEFTAITQYTYQHVVSSKMSEEISKILEEISIVEMHHLELLCSAMMCFGAKPEFKDGKGQWFSANYANYSPRLIDMLRANIKSESQAIYDYTCAADQVNNESLRQLFLRIAEDEKCHLQTFEELYKQVEFFGK